MSASVLENHARPVLAESLLSTARSWPLPDWLRPPYRRAGGRAYTVCVAHVTDRTEASNRSARHLPEAMRGFVSRDLFAEWMQEIRRGDSLATWADFVVSEVRSLDRWQATNGPDLLHSPELMSKRRFGLLQTSPGGRWVLDPHQGMDVDSLGGLARDIDTGFRVYDAATGGLVLHHVSTTEWIALAAWPSDSCFVLAGSTPIEPFGGCEIPVRAPVIWSGNPFSGELTTFLGTPLSHWQERRVWDGWHRVFRKAYPKIRGEP